MRAADFIFENDEPTRIKIGGAEAAAKARAWIERVYARYPQTMQNNHVMTWGSGDDLQFAIFELTPSFSKRGAVEVKWFQAYPLRQGVGSKAMKELQALAREDDISLTLFPWDKGQVSQSKLTKFYKGQGFAPSVKGGKAMQWTPELAEGVESLDYQGNCTEDEVVDEIFGDVNNFARMVEEHGDEFTVGKLVVKYDPETDIHSFYYKKSDVAEGLESLDDLNSAYQHHVELSRKYRKKGNREKDQHHTTQAFNIIQQIWEHPDYKLEFTDDPFSSQKNDALSMKHDSRFNEQSLAESLRVDVPDEEWLQNAIDYAKQKSPDRNGLPYMGKTTATVRQVEVPLMLLRRIPGMRNEQQNVRYNDLAAIEKIMKDTGKLPLHAHSGEEYKPFINVAYDGSAWVNEGNHRIMAAYRLGWDSLPVEISYFDGGERVESGPMYPGKIGL